MPFSFSKSSLLAYAQCRKSLWLAVHNPEAARPDPQAAQRKLDGERIGRAAWELFPGGTFIEAPGGDYDAALATTSELMAAGLQAPAYEATFRHENLLVRVDILSPGERGLILTEVKSSTKIEPHLVLDCSVQLWVLQQRGFEVEKVNLALVDTGHVLLEGEGAADVLKVEDVTGQAQEEAGRIAALLAGGRVVLEGECPVVPMGSHCKKPHLCEFQAHCASEGPEYPLSCLCGIRAKGIEEFRRQGCNDIRDIPEAALAKKPVWQRIVRATKAGQAELLPGAKAVIDALAWPRFHLDFETIGTAVPLWPGTRPYEAISFQWSCHIEPDPDALDHREFLDLSGKDPRREFAETMLATLEEPGPIIVYTSYEKRIINALAAWFPDLARPLQALVDRLVDLEPVAREHYYHPSMKGSWSIKKLLPAVAPDLDYSQLNEVHDGIGAQIAYLEAIGPGTPEVRRAQLRERMLLYCGLDTMAMVRVCRFLGQ
jgi:hypothetical protein